MDARQPRDMQGRIIGFGDKVAYAVARKHEREYSAMRVGTVYGMRFDPLAEPEHQFLIQAEHEYADNLFHRFSTRRLNKLIVVQAAGTSSAS